MIEIKNKYYFYILALSISLNIVVASYMILSRKSNDSLVSDCIIYNITGNGILGNDSVNLMKIYLNNLYDTSSSLFNKTLASIKEYRSSLDEYFNNESKNLSLSRTITIKAENIKHFKKFYEDLVSYINDFRRIIYKIEIVKKFF
jgi:hypothetical protein